MNEVKNGNGKALWTAVGSFVAFILVMVTLFGFFVKPLTDRVERLEKENADKTLLINSNATRITTLESEVKFYRDDTNDDNNKIVTRLEKLESQQGTIISQQGTSIRFLEMLTKKQKEQILSE